MKKLSIIIAILAISLSAFSQKGELSQVLNSCDKVNITDVNVEKTSREIKVSFRITPAKRAVRSNYKMTLIPYLCNDTQTIKLLPIEVIGKQWVRKEKQKWLLTGFKENTPSVQIIPENRPSNYSVSIPYDRETMRTMSLRIEQRVEGCCNATLLANQLLVSRVQLYVEPLPVVRKVARTPVLKKVNRKWQFSKDILTIHFHLSTTKIDDSLFENKQVLDEIITVVNAIRTNPEQVLRKIEITGFASPEGSYSQNQNLAINRATALKNYIRQEIPLITDSSFVLNNGGENWEGTRRMVAASDMKYRDEVLAILDKTPINKQELQNLRAGQPYHYIVREFFSTLRNACYIAVYYDIFADEAADTINDALTLIDAKEYGEALDKLQSVNSDPRAYNAIGVCYMMTERELQAQEWFEKAIATGDAEAIKNLEQIK